MKKNAKLKLINNQAIRWIREKKFPGDHTLGTYYGSKVGQHYFLWLKGTITGLEEVILID